MNLIKSKLQIFITLVFLGYVGWWYSFQRVVLDQGISTQRFGYTYGSLALFGAIVGFIAAIKWGGFKTVLGKALMFFSIGLLAQDAGQLIYAYYIYVAKIDIPYPSWGDVAYATSTLSYICAAAFLAKTAGVKFSLNKNAKYKMIAVIVPVAILSVSFWVFLRHHEYDFHQPLTVGLDFGYPVGDALYISLAIIAYLLSRKLLGGIMRAGIVLVIAALSLQYIADFTFLYQSSRGTYVAGKYDDLFYLIAYFATATALIKFLNIYKELKDRTKLAAKSSDSPQATEGV